MSKKKTVGQAAVELQEKKPDTRDPIELQREMQKDWEENLIEALNRGKKLFHDNFYVVIETKKERLLQNVIRNYFFARKSCPTPAYDQTVYRYLNNDIVEFLWVIPSKDTCQLFKENALLIAPEEQELLQYVLLFEDGTLLQHAKKLNNEIEGVPA